MGPLAGVRVGVQGHRELGRTGTRDDGRFDLAVNGGGRLTLTFDKQGYPSAYRQVATTWQEYTVVPDVALVAYDTT